MGDKSNVLSAFFFVDPINKFRALPVAKRTNDGLVFSDFIIILFQLLLQRRVVDNLEEK